MSSEERGKKDDDDGLLFFFAPRLFERANDLLRKNRIKNKSSSVFFSSFHDFLTCCPRREKSAERIDGETLW